MTHEVVRRVDGVCELLQVAGVMQCPLAKLGRRTESGHLVVDQ